MLSLMMQVATTMFSLFIGDCLMSIVTNSGHRKVCVVVSSLDQSTSQFSVRQTNEKVGSSILETYAVR